MSKVKDTNYLAITAMLAARETKMLSAERMERMIDAPTNEEAAKILEECGYGDPHSPTPTTLSFLSISL